MTWNSQPWKPLLAFNLKKKKYFLPIFSGKWGLSVVIGKIIIRVKQKPWNSESATLKTLLVSSQKKRKINNLSLNYDIPRYSEKLLESQERNQEIRYQQPWNLALLALNLKKRKKNIFFTNFPVNSDFLRYSRKLLSGWIENHEIRNQQPRKLLKEKEKN